ncbi:MAG TPA: DUF47 family protein [Gammaproteobacteria bacterium]|nr:DUF47 family protein [Gammaproteobacteria bacterium]
MLKRLLPKQDNFFELFQQTAHQVVSAAELFSRLMQDLAHTEQYAKDIAEHEAIADNCARATFDLLHKTFITPFDRHDIHQLTRKLDDILDMTNRTTQRIALYQLQALPEGLHQIALCALDAAKAIKTALKQLEYLKNAPEIIRLCRTISEADNQAERIMLQGVGELFAQEMDFKQLLKLKEIYEYSTYIVRECHDLADIVKGIVLEYS